MQAESKWLLANLGCRVEHIVVRTWVLDKIIMVDTLEEVPGAPAFQDIAPDAHVDGSF